MKTRSCLASISALLACAVGAGANLLTNGDFELYQYPGPFTFVAAGSNVYPTGWSYSGADTFVLHTASTAVSYLRNTTFGPAHSGTQYMDLSGGDPTAPQHPVLYQDIATTPGLTYTVSFYTGASNIRPVSHTIRVFAEGSTMLLDRTVRPVRPGSRISWQKVEFQFLADSTTTRIGFQDTFAGVDDNVSFIDDVDVSESATPYVPPATQSQLVVERFGAAAGTTAQFLTIGQPIMNTNGRVAFTATLTGPGVTAMNNSGIWADDSTGNRQLVRRKGDAAPDTAGATFTGFTDPVYNAHEKVAFRGALSGGDTVRTPLNNSIGIWSNSGGTLRLVARLGTQAPGTPTGATFASFLQYALPDQGGVLLLAALKTGSTTAPDPGGTTAANNLGIWAVDTAGDLRLIVRKGDVHPETGSVITGLSFLPAAPLAVGQTRSFDASTGDLIYVATFADGTQGVFKVVFP